MSVKTFNGRAIASMKTFDGRAAANVKTILGVTASSYIVSQDCEGGGIPTNAQAAGTLPDGWVDSGSPEWNYSTAPLEGTYSWRVPSNATSNIYSRITVSGGPYSDVWAYALIKITANSTIAGRGLFAWHSATGSGVGLFNSSSDTTRRITCGTISISTITLTLNTTYSIWLHYVQGGGTAGADLLAFYSSTTTTIPGSPTATILTGNRGSGVNVLTLGRPASSSGGAFLIDHIRASTSAIGSNPS